MMNRQPQGLPLRIYEPNIIHNPFTWFGVWTPCGWRVHRKRFGRAQRLTVRLSGDGKTTFFPNALLDPVSQRVEWQDDLHQADDPFTDAGIYPCDPRIEYPPGTPRWAVSHTLLCYPVADHNLYTHEYTWDMVSGHLQTHFRNHVKCEAARTDACYGRTVSVAHKPISTTIEGNVLYPNNNSAVRGVWANPLKTGRNFYARRVLQKIAMHYGVYAVAPLTPVVQCRGMYELQPSDTIDGLFDQETDECRDPNELASRLRIAVDAPKLGLLELGPFTTVQSWVYEGQLSMMSRQFGVVEKSLLDAARKHLNARFDPGRVGYAFENAVDSDDKGYAGYTTRFDFDEDGVITEADLAVIETNLGRSVRLNLYHGAYFGGDWLSTTVCLTPNHEPGASAVADYAVGGGYDADSGVIQLLDTPGPNQPVWIEYHYDAPAETGTNNIVIHLYRETP